MNRIVALTNPPAPHWVGDGFPVRSVFSYQGLGQRISPFLLLDHAAPQVFAPAPQPRGVGVHPHRGFETVSIVFQGELAHRDSAGNSGTIGPGDVQWMTAAGGILHEEFHSPGFTAKGGTLEMAQLWVNLPASAKMAAPAYQDLRRADIPEVPLGEQGARLRVIAGELAGVRGPARTATPVELGDVSLPAGVSVELAFPAGHTAAVVVLAGRVRLNGERDAVIGQLALFERSGEAFTVEAVGGEAKLLLLGGEPINEPIVGYGPFVMNSETEIRQAVADFHAGKFGVLAPQAA